MLPFAPLPLIDDFLVGYNAGQAILVLFVLAVVGSIIVAKSRRALALNLIVFGLLFAVTPSSEAPYHWRLLGIALLVCGPMVYVTASR